MTSEPNKGTSPTQQPSPEREGKTDKVAGKIANGILFVQERFSNRMNRLKGLRTILVCFCVISGSLSIYFFVDAIVSKPKSNAKIRIDQIRSPKPIDEPSEGMYDEKIPDEIYYSIQEYKRYMDSTGEAIRPGLADSMRTLEQIYLQQQKK